MKTALTKSNYISIVLKLIVIVSAVVGTILSAMAGTEFMSGDRVFMYFTIQSNIAIAVICAVGLFLIVRNKALHPAWPVIKFVGTVSITLTGMVFCFVLAPTLGEYAWNPQNVLTHVVVPLASVVDFFFVFESVAIRRRNVFFVIIPPIAYTLYAGIGFIYNWQFAKDMNYPYFFLNWDSPAGAVGVIDELPYLGVVWWILILIAFLILVGIIYLLIAERIYMKKHK